MGGLYASGYTPDEIIQFFKSDNFKEWSETDIPNEELYFFKKCDNIPYFFSVKFPFDKNKSIHLKSGWIPVSLLSPHGMNFSLFELTRKANVISKNNFDSLFVSFRCVASDVYNKKAFIFKNGPLNDAIRASMTFPFVIKPAETDGHLLFDGGIYNNFPANVMKEEFHPDFTIGSVVAYNPPVADKRDTYMQLQNMIIQPTDYNISDHNSLLFNFNLKKYDTFDFSKVDELVKIGYDSAMAHIDEIKSKIQTRSDSTELAEKRKKFLAKKPELKFLKISFTGIDTQQQQYVKHFFTASNQGLSLEQFKTSYFKLISDETISEVIPTAIYNDTTGKYDVNMAIETHNLLKVSTGGNVSTNLNNEVDMGLNLHVLTSFSNSLKLNAQAGKLYKGLDLSARSDFPARKNIFLQLSAGIHHFDYFRNNSWFYEDDLLPVLIQNEVTGLLKAGIATGMHSVLEAGVGVGYLTDLYSSVEALPAALANKDKNILHTGKLFLKIQGNKLNHPAYPTKGYQFLISVQHFWGSETFQNSDDPVHSSTTLKRWSQLHATCENYFGLSSLFSIGLSGELMYSNRLLSWDYNSTIAQSISFRPTLISRTFFNPGLYSNQFVSAGIKPIINITKNIQLRTDLYVFEPYQSIHETSDHKAYFSYGFTAPKLFSESVLIYKFRNASAAIYTTNYQGKWNIGFNLGVLLKHEKFNE